MLARAMLCILLCLGAHSAQAATRPARATGESLGVVLSSSLPMLLAAAPIQLRSAPSDANELRITGLGGGSTQWTIVVLMTFLTLIPSMLICMTPFARMLIVFH